MIRWTTIFLDFHQSKWDKSYSQSNEGEIEVSPVYVLYSSNIVIPYPFYALTNLLYFTRRCNLSGGFYCFFPFPAKIFFIAITGCRIAIYNHPVIPCPVQKKHYKTPLTQSELQRKYGASGYRQPYFSMPVF